MQSQSTQEALGGAVQNHTNRSAGGMFEFWAKQAESLRTERAIETDADLPLGDVEAHQQRQLIVSILGYLPDNHNLDLLTRGTSEEYGLAQQVGPTEQELARLPHQLRRKRPYERLSLAQMYFWSVDAHGESSVTSPSSTNLDTCRLPTAFDLALSEAQAAECAVVDLDIRKAILDHASMCPQQCGTPSCSGSQTFAEIDVLKEYLAEREPPSCNWLVKDFRESMAAERSAYRHRAFKSACACSHLPSREKATSSSVRPAPAERSWKGQARSYNDRQDVALYDALIDQWFTACEEVVSRRLVVEKMLLDIPSQQSQPVLSSDVTPQSDSLRHVKGVVTTPEVTGRVLFAGPPLTAPPDKPLPALPLTDASAAPERDMGEQSSASSYGLTGSQPGLALVECLASSRSPSGCPGSEERLPRNSSLAKTAAVMSTPRSESTRSSSPAASLATRDVSASSLSSVATAPTSCAAELQLHDPTPSTQSKISSTSRASRQLPELAILPRSAASPQSDWRLQGKSLKRRSQSSMASVAFTVASGSDMPSLPPLSDIESDDDCGDSVSHASTIPGVTEMDLEIARMRRRLGTDVEY